MALLTTSFFYPTAPDSAEFIGLDAGIPEGGLFPIGRSPSVVQGLALVPDGLSAVVIFPPTADQQVPALSVIFSELPTTRVRCVQREQK